MKISIEITSNPSIIAREDFFSNDSLGLNGVYVMYDISGVCLYVGKTKDFIKRIRQHARQSYFYSSIEYVEFYHVSSEYKKDIIETYLINEFRPIYNKAKAYYLQRDLEEKLAEIEDEEHSVRSQINDIKYSIPQSVIDGLHPVLDDYEIEAINFEEKVDGSELAELEQRLRRLHKYKYEVATRLSL